MPKQVIVKVQRPLSGSEGHMDDWLIYDKTRAINTMIKGKDASSTARRVMKGIVFKAFFHAAIDPDGRIIIGARTADQNW